MSSKCPVHGEHRLLITEDNEEKFDMNVFKISG